MNSTKDTELEKIFEAISNEKIIEKSDFWVMIEAPNPDNLEQDIDFFLIYKKDGVNCFSITGKNAPLFWEDLIKIGIKHGLTFDNPKGIHHKIISSHKKPSYYLSELNWEIHYYLKKISHLLGFYRDTD